MFFPFRCYGSMSVFIAIAPGLGWSLVLCPRSFTLVPSGKGLSLCLRRLFAPCYCQRVSWWSSMRLRVFVSSGLSPGFFPFGGPRLSNVCSSVCVPLGVAHTFHPSLLLIGVLVRFCDGPCCRSLAMSWACLPPLLFIGLVFLSLLLA